MLVDCGLFQGCHACEDENWKPFPFEPSSVPLLLVTHAHIDHIGRIPKLVRDGFKGKIFSTEATKSIALPLLLDSMELLRQAANRSGREPLYEEEDIRRAMEMWEGFPYQKEIPLTGGITLKFLNSSHILGSAMIELAREGKSIVFTGDLGGHSPLLSSRDHADPDYLVMESVYGDRERAEDGDRRDKLENAIEDIAARGGTLLIPAFSTERTQDLLFEICSLMTEKKVPSMPVYVDSPLASAMTKAFLDHPSYFSPKLRKQVEAGENIFSFPELQFTETLEASRAADAKAGPKILLAGSGMSNGGRVLEHEGHILGDPNSTLLIVGYQAAGSLGRRLLEGEKEVEIHRQSVKVRCRIEAIFGYSAHLDGPALLDFVSHMKKVRHAFVVMGEPHSASFLAQRIQDYLGISAQTPEAGESVTIEL